MRHTNEDNLSKEDEIDLIEIVASLWKARKKILKITVSFFFLGILIGILTPPTYTAKTVIMLQSSSGETGVGKLSGLASLAGINLNLSNSDSGISPMVYSQIMNSQPFLLELINTPLASNKNKTYRDYIEKDRAGILDSFKDWLSGILRKDSPAVSIAGVMNISKEDFKIISDLIKKISLTIDEDTGTASIMVSMDDAIIAAEMTSKTQLLLQNYVTKYKIEKAQSQLEFVENRLKEKRKEYEALQTKLALFKDRNRYVSTELSKTELDRLNSEFSLVFDVYTDLAKQYESAQIKVKEDTPVFTVIEPVSIPQKKSNLRTSLMAVIFGFVGLIVSSAYVLIPFKSIFEQVKKA